MPSRSGFDHMLVRVILVFLLLAVAVSLAGYYYYENQHRRITKNTLYELAAITNLKAGQIDAWRRERLGDANGIAQTGFVADRVQKYLDNPAAPRVKHELLAWMRSFQKVNNYRSILLADHAGRPLLATVAAEAALDTEELKALRRALRAREAVMSDLHRSAEIPFAHFEVVSPLTVIDGTSRPPVGALILRLDPERFLYPLVRTWPTPRASGETVLLRREGDEAVMLNEARHRADTALTLRIPLGGMPDLTSLLDRKASGILEAVDYRGVPVLAAVQPVPGTSWFLSSKIDREEIYEPLHEQALLMLLVLAGLIGTAGFSIAFWWRRKSAEHLRGQYEAELQRRALSARYEYLSLYANDSILLVDPEGGIKEANNRAEAVYGYTRDELLRMNIRDLRPPETHKDLPAQMRSVRERAGFLFETVHRRKNGTSFPVEVSSTFIDVDGNGYYQSIIRDITERRQAEDALRNSEAKYRELTDLLPQTVYETDDKGNFTFINEYGFAAYGYTREDFDRGLNVLQLLVPGDRERAKVNFGKRLSGEPMGQNEYTVMGRDGTPHSVLIYASPVIRNGIAAGLRGIVMDITDRKRTERALQESEHRYKRLVESVTDYIYTVEVEKGRAVATYHGPGCVTVTGYTSEEFEASPDLWARMIHEADRPRVLSHVERVLAGEPVPSFEHRIIHKDGSLRWVRNTAVPRHDENGRLIAYDGLITDETQLRLLENQLRQAQKMEAVGQLAGGVAHDFNNILTAIIGYANLLLMKMPEAEHGRAYVEQILASSDRAARLTHSLLAFSRKQLINLRPIDVNEVIRRVERLLIRVIGEDVEFKTRLCDGDTTVLADSIHVEQALMNLATNARDAMPDGGTLLIETDLFLLGEDFVRAHSYGTPGRYVRISVTDTGVGMEEAVRSRIFEPFFTTKEVGKGTGLGLAMVYGIVKQHNGYINVYSEPGRATTFKIYLPVVAAAADEKTGQEAADLPRGAETVLLAEDDDAVRNMTRNVLEDFGYTVIEAVDGEDAVRKFREHGERVDLLVLDMIMPRKNGKEACREIMEIRPGVKALFTSGYTADLVHKKGILEPGVNFIVKPSTPAAFLLKVREVLDT